MFHALALLIAIGQAPVAEVRFGPRGGCEAEVVAEVAAARSWVRVQAYSFTSIPIADALIAAHARGVDVAVVADRSQPTAKGSQVVRLAAAGVAVRIDARHPIAHSKTVNIDGATVLTGSFNFTHAAEASNLENLVTIRDPSLSAAYGANWSLHAGHSEPLALPSPQAP